MIVKNYKYPLFHIENRIDLRDLMRKTAERLPDKLSFYEKNKNDEYEGISFSEFEKLVQFCGEGLLNLKLNQREKIALIGKNCRAWAVSYLAITTSNFIVIPVDKELKDFEVEAIIKRSRARAVVCESKFFPMLEAIKSKNSFIEYIIPFEPVSGSTVDYLQLIETGKRKFDTDSSYKKIRLNPEEVTSILFTSGTTGTPKGVMLSQRNILDNIHQMRQLYEIDERDTFLSVLPLHHSYECTCGFLCQIHAGSAIAYAQSLKKIADNLKESKATIMLGVPLLFESFYKRIKQAGFSGFAGKLKFGVANFICSFSEIFLRKNIRRKIFHQIHEKFGGKLLRFISGGAALPKEVAVFFSKIGIMLVQGYGITECSPLLAVNRMYSDKPMFFRYAAAGMPAVGVDIEIFDKDENGIGEIAAKGPNIMMGYYEDEKATEQVFHDGYFLTGDYGYLDKDNFLYISGRKKDIIITKNGKNVYPEEIEFLYNGSEIIEEIVVKEGMEPGTTEPTILAAVKPNYEKLSEILSVSEEELRKNSGSFIHLIKKEIKENNKKLSHFKMIKFFSIRTEEFERTTTKKVKRFTVKIEGNLINVY